MVSNRKPTYSLKNLLQRQIPYATALGSNPGLLAKKPASFFFFRLMINTPEREPCLTEASFQLSKTLDTPVVFYIFLSGAVSSFPNIY
jgi:hypothetical protein